MWLDGGTFVGQGAPHGVFRQEDYPDLHYIDAEPIYPAVPESLYKLLLFAGTALPCLRCGECCKAAACCFGKWELYPVQKQPWDREGQCVHLGETGKDAAGNALYECKIASEIQKDPTSIVSPAFGAGCCRTLFNEARDRIKRGRKS